MEKTVSPLQFLSSLSSSLLTTSPTHMYLLPKANSCPYHPAAPSKLSKTWVNFSFSPLYFHFLISDDLLPSTYIIIYGVPLPKTHCLPHMLGPKINLSSLVCQCSKLCSGT